MPFRHGPTKDLQGGKNDIYDHDRVHTLLLCIYKVKVSRPNKAFGSSSTVRMTADFENRFVTARASIPIPQT